MRVTAGGDDDDDDEDDTKTSKTTTKRKRGRPRRTESEEEDQDEKESYPRSECQSMLDSAWKTVESTHSAQDFTPFIALFYAGIRTTANRGYKESDITKSVAKIFHLEQDQVLQHLSEFVENQNRANSKDHKDGKDHKANPNKKRRTE